LIWVGRSLAGLFAQRDCDVSVEIVDWFDENACFAVDVDGTKLAIDLFDRSDRWSAALMEWSDVYAKRSMHPAHPGPAPEKIVPYGIHLGARSRRSALATCMALAKALPRKPRINPRELYQYLVAPRWQDFEVRPDVPLDNTILYQTRVWEAKDCPGDEQINDERIDLIRALKSEFKERFLGGVVPTEYAKEKYPDLLTTLPTRHPQYVKWAKRPAIAIHTRGLFGATGIKMSEFLAASKAIVSDPLENTLPAPLAHVAQFASPEVCVAACQRLLSSPEMLREQRQASWDYYCKYVQAPASMRRLVDIAKQWKQTHN
jgi:hypothetical protein